ncbi:MAG TPA: PAS domain-containing protein, partial [Puia sp.]|nr:PAS domain-containing protein [Puia sp.]
LGNSDLKYSLDYVRAIIETIREPLMVLSTELRVMTINHAFSSMFRISQEDAEGNYLYEIGHGMFDLPDLRTHLKKLASKNSGLHDFEIKHTFAGLGNKVLVINARQMSVEPGKGARILVAIEDITDRRQATG